MENLKERNIIKKISVIILMVMIFSMIIPNYSNAGLVSIIKKPISGFVMTSIDSFNALLATVFASDAKIEEAKEGASDIKDISRSDKSFFEKVSDGLNEFESTYYNLLLSPDDIFSGKVQITDANIFSNKYDEDGALGVSDINLFNHLMKQLKQTTAGLYYVMRNLAVVILLCLLIYSGIRIVMSANSSSEKAKWKMHLIDWLKALALVMFIHVIMIGIFYIADVIMEGLNGTLSSGDTLVSVIRMNFDNESILDVTGSLVYIIMYLYVTFLTVVFLVAYFKRLFYIIVLIITAPIISSLYALGKTRKQSFGYWLKEFTMGVMVQPFHMLIYSVLLLIPMKIMNSSGIDTKFIKLSTIDAQIYALLAISMIRPIEKYMRKIFGFGSTSLDNMASFESGKKTVDAGVKAAVTVAATVATAGAAAGAIGVGAAAGAGGAGAAAGAGGAGAAAGAGGAAGAGTAGAETGGMARTAGKSLLQSDSNLLEGQNIKGEDDALDQLIEDSYNGDWSPEDYKAFDELYDEQEKRKTRFAENNEEKLDFADRNTGKQNGLNRNNLVLDNANVQINNPKGMGVESQKGILEGSDLAKALGGKLGGKFETLKENPYLQAITSPGMLEQFEKLRTSMHEFTDSLYMPNDANGDWKNNQDLLQEKIKDRKTIAIDGFSSDPENIKKAIKKYGLKDIVNSKTGKIITAESQAEKKLKGNIKDIEPYIALGIRDFDKIDSLQKTGLKPKEAMKFYASNESKINAFINNTNNLQQMRTLIADKMNIPEDKRSDINISNQINQQIDQDLKTGTPYIASGAAKDPETLNRLLDLERKIDNDIQMRGTKAYSKTNYVEKADKIIEKAVKDNVKNIKLPNSENKKEVKQLQDIMNKELEERKNSK